MQPSLVPWDSTLPAGEGARCVPSCWLLIGPMGRECASWGEAPQVLRMHIEAVQPGGSLWPLDLPGTGRLWRQASPSRISGVVEELRRRVAQDGHTGPFGLIASSWASCVATEWARQYADEIGAVVLISPAMRPFTPVLRSLDFKQWVVALGQVLGRRSPFEPDTRLLRSHTNGLRPATADLVAHWRALRRKHPLKARNGWRQLLAVWRYQSSKRRAHPSVLLLAGKADVWMDWRVSAAISRAWGSALRLHPEGGHDLLLDDPQWVARSMAKWLLPLRLADWAANAT